MEKEGTQTLRIEGMKGIDMRKGLNSRIKTFSTSFASKGTDLILRDGE